jgi:hypothetical protein
MRDSIRMTVAHEPLHPAVPKEQRSHHTSPPLDVARTHTTRSGGASSSSSTNSRFFKMFWGIFAMRRRIDQCMDVMETCLDIVHHNQEIIHSQRDESLIDFPDVPIYPHVPDSYASLTPAELATFGIRPSLASADYDDDDEGAANDEEETKDDEYLARHLPLLQVFSLFAVLMPTEEKIVISIIFHFF